MVKPGCPFLTYVALANSSSAAAHSHILNRLTKKSWQRQAPLLFRKKDASWLEACHRPCVAYEPEHSVLGHSMPAPAPNKTTPPVGKNHCFPSSEVPNPAFPCPLEGQTPCRRPWYRGFHDQKIWEEVKPYFLNGDARCRLA